MVRAATLRSSAFSFEGVLDRAEVWRVGREVAQPSARRLDCRAGAGTSMRWQIVHHDEIARSQRRRRHLFDVGEERLSVHRAVEHHGRGQAAQAQGSGEGGRLPMTMRDGRTAALAPWGAATRTGHLGGRSGLIDEDQALGIEVRLRVEPSLALRGDVGPLLFVGVRGFF
jgi:hypothetical protein